MNVLKHVLIYIKRRMPTHTSFVMLFTDCVSQFPILFIHLKLTNSMKCRKCSLLVFVSFPRINRTITTSDNCYLNYATTISAEPFLYSTNLCRDISICLHSFIKSSLNHCYLIRHDLEAHWYIFFNVLMLRIKSIWVETCWSLGSFCPVTNWCLCLMLVSFGVSFYM